MRVPRMGLGEELHRAYFRSVQLNGSGPKDKDWAGVILKGLVDDVTLHHHVVFDIFREFGDMVYVTIPATVIGSA